MRRPLILIFIVGAGTLAALWLLLQTPGSLHDALSNPFEALWGTQKQLSSTLLEVSETAEPVRAASRRLLQPFGKVRLVRIYDSSGSDTPKKH